MKPSSTPTKHSNGKRFIILCFFFILFLCSLAFVNEIRYDNLLKISKCAFLPTTSFNSSSAFISDSIKGLNSSATSSLEEIKVLVGVLTLPDQYPKLHFLRMIYGTQSLEGARVDLKFVFCNLTKEDQKVLVALEIMQYNDIIILNCTENMDKGKTYTYFSSLPDLFNSPEGPNPPYDYVFKTDDDTYFRLDSLIKSLRPLPRDDVYYGLVIPCRSMDPFVDYMSGMGYMVSWDIVEWIRVSDIPKDHIEGPEDRVFTDWIRSGRRGKNRVTPKWSMYDYPVPYTACTHELHPDTIAVHRLKNQEKWIKTLQYFNVTKDLKPSKMYHID